MYDSIYQLAIGIDFAIARGQNYEEADTLYPITRMSRFSGCSGTVQFE
jgi:hypothetical protein